MALVSAPRTTPSYPMGEGMRQSYGPHTLHHQDGALLLLYLKDQTNNGGTGASGRGGLCSGRGQGSIPGKCKWRTGCEVGWVMGSRRCLLEEQADTHLQVLPTSPSIHITRLPSTVVKVEPTLGELSARSHGGEEGRG